MLELKRSWILGLFLAGLSTVALSADAVKGTAALSGQSVTFTYGFGIWNGKDRPVVIGFFPKPLSAADQAAALTDNFLNSGGNDPYVVLRLSFPETAANAAKIDGCEIDYFGYAAHIHQFVERASDCGVVELAGDLRLGGVVHGHLKGSGKNDDDKTHTWDLDFATTLRDAAKAKP